MRHIRAILILACAALFASPLHAATRNFTLANFDSVRIEGDMEVTVTSGKPMTAQASGAQEDIRRLDLRVQDRTLYIRFNKADAEPLLDSAKNLPLKVALEVRTLRKIEIFGNADAVVDRLSGREVGANLYGTGSLRIGDMDAIAAELNYNAIGGQLVVSGRTEDLRATSRGTGMLDASGLFSETLYMIGEGPVSSRFTASGTARISVSVDSRVDVRGGAECDIVATQNSEVICEPA